MVASATPSFFPFLNCLLVELLGSPCAVPSKVVSVISYGDDNKGNELDEGMGIATYFWSECARAKNKKWMWVWVVG